MAAIITIFVIATLFGIYSQFAIDNGSNIDAKYYNVLKNISDMNSDKSATSLWGIGSKAQNQSIVKSILDFGQNLATGTVNVFVVGLDAMGQFFSMIPLIGSIFTLIDVIPGFSGLMGLMIILTGVYIAMRYIQSTSNKFELP
jgi:hypothetical protein